MRRYFQLEILFFFQLDFFWIFLDFFLLIFSIAKGPLVDFHNLIIPVSHVSSTLVCSDDVYQEILK